MASSRLSDVAAPDEPTRAAGIYFRSAGVRAEVDFFLLPK